MTEPLCHHERGFGERYDGGGPRYKTVAGATACDSPPTVALYLNRRGRH